jgi:hypothetical protein
MPYLQGIRARLGQFMKARDEVYRHTRREALDLRREPFSEPAATPALKGNDLREALVYHASSALDAAYAAGDSLALVIATRDGLPAGNHRQISLHRLIDADSAWAKKSNAVAARNKIVTGPRHTFALAARELRNGLAHRNALSNGHLAFHPPEPGPEPSVVWVTREDFAGHRRADAFYEAVLASADFNDGEMAVLGFQRLIDETWRATADVVSCGLKALPWSDRSWFRKPPRSRRLPRMPWWTHTQRALWGID